MTFTPPPARAALGATLTSRPTAASVATLPRTIEWLELRADRIGEVDAGMLRRGFPGQLLYALRPAADGGGFTGGGDERRRLLAAAAERFDLVELSAERDLEPELLARVPPAKRLISWYGETAPAAALARRFARLAAIPARFYKLVTAARASGEELAPLALLGSLRRTDVIAFAGGKTGFWTRLVAPRLGCPVTFGAPGPTVEEAEPSLTQLIADYGLPELPPARRVFGIVGDGVLRSLSPRLHNAAYRHLGLTALYLPFHADSFTDFWHGVTAGAWLADLAVSLAGLTVVAPHKEAVPAAADTRSPVVELTGAGNLLVRAGGGWRAGSTDPEGILEPLRERGVAVRARPAAVVGCGAAGRAAAVALAGAGARVVLVNRDRNRGRDAAARLGLPFVPWPDFDPRGLAVVVHATPIGKDDGELPFAVEPLAPDTVVIDLVYGSAATPLVAAARGRGLRVVDGREVLVAQTRHQLRAMTGREVAADRLRAFLDPRDPVCLEK